MLRIGAALAVLLSVATVHGKGVLKLADRRLVAGDTVRVSGEKFPKAANLTMLLVGPAGRTRLTEIRSDSGGLFRVAPVVPADLPAGAYRLIVVASDGDAVGALDVEIVPVTQRGHPAAHTDGAAEPSAQPLTLERARSPWVTGATLAGIVVAVVVGGVLLRRRHPITVVMTMVTLLAAAALAAAHDFWLIPDAFQVAEGATIDVRGQTSSRFPTSEAAVALDRVADAQLIGASGSSRISDLSHRGTSLLLRHKPAAAGQYVVAIALRPRSVRESVVSFRRYLELEGAPEALALIERQRLLEGRDSVTRRYAKYAKTVVQVGSSGPPAFALAAGQPLEFVPERDPAALAVGDTLRVRVLYRGRPLAAVVTRAGAVDLTADRGAPPPRAAGQGTAGASPNAESADVREDPRLMSDAAGRVHVPISRPGLWNVRMIHIVQAEPGSGADWDAHWATLVFSVREAAPKHGESGAGVSGAQHADSLAVVAAVERYHRALAQGDSVAALSLLAPDALILESGVVETREEYRSHHLPADIQFARAVPSPRGPVRVVVRGDVAWAVSKSTTRGAYRGQAIDSEGAELAVVTREAAGWKIRAIHWSSRTKRSPG